MMDNIQSWSSFDQHQRRNPQTARRSAAETTSDEGMDALYVSASSPNISQSAASLLQQAGLSGGDTEEEFRLKFHWMRPHPSLAFQIEDEMIHRTPSGGSTEENVGVQQHNKPSCNKKETLHPAVKASRLMRAHINAQLDNATSIGNDDDIKSSRHKANEHEVAAVRDPSLDLPIEMPEVRINLAGLVEPPLMSSWLPIEEVQE